MKQRSQEEAIVEDPHEAFLSHEVCHSTDTLRPSSVRTLLEKSDSADELNARDRWCSAGLRLVEPTALGVWVEWSELTMKPRRVCLRRSPKSKNYDISSSLGALASVFFPISLSFSVTINDATWQWFRNKKGDAYVGLSRVRKVQIWPRFPSIRSLQPEFHPIRSNGLWARWVERSRRVKKDVENA